VRRGCEGGGQSGKARDGSAIRKLLADVEEANDREWEVWRLGIRGNATGVAVQREWRDMSVGMENVDPFGPKMSGRMEFQISCKTSHASFFREVA